MQGPDDWAEFYTVPNVQNDTQVEKQYYLVITLAGHGVLATAGMKSGSKNLRQPQDMKYWMDELVELGLADAATQARLQKQTWSVRFLLRLNCQQGRVNACI